MTTETILTDDEICKTLVDAGILLVPQEITGYDIVIARAIEQAVLQSPEIQALRKDAERYRWLRRGAIEDAAVVQGLGAMDYGLSVVVSTYSEEIVAEELDEVIDAAMEQQK